jgi:opacity protein-like surface antigen
MKGIALLIGCMGAAVVPSVQADENLLGYISGAETLPKEASEAYLWLTQRSDKGRGDYTAHDAKPEYEYGHTNRLTGSLALKGQSIDTSGLVIDAYLPGPEKYGMRPSGVEAALKYNILSAAKDDIGLSVKFELAHSWLDPHSGQDKSATSAEFSLQLQKFFLDDQLVAMLNSGLEATYAVRDPLSPAAQSSADAATQALTGDPLATFDWPTKNEMEVELQLGGGLSYRFAPNWYVGAETLYETEFETEIGQERWSVFAGPSIHYGGKLWWATLTWFGQMRGGGSEKYINQADDNLHLIEKTRQAIRFKLGYNF